MSNSLNPFKSEMPKVSVLMANYNNGKFIKNAIESFSSQTYENKELIIVDDASSEDTYAIIKDFSDNHDSIFYFQNQTNKGYGYTLRKAVENSSGDFFAILDADDQLLPEAIQTLMNEFFNHPEASLIYSNMYMCDENLNIIEKNKKIGSIPPGLTYQMVTAEQNTHVMHFRIMAKSKYNKTEGFNPRFLKAIDKDIIYKLEEVGPLIFVDKPLFCYRQHSGGISLFKNKWKARLWEVKAKKLAFNRRKKSNIPSLSEREINLQFEEVYKQLCFEAFEEKQWYSYLKYVAHMFLLNYSLPNTGRFIYYSIKKMINPELFR